jgi:5-methylcytosine-specific restriction protein A
MPIFQGLIMPWAAPRPCNAKGCRNLITGRLAYCKEHTPLVNENRPETDQLYNTQRWKNLRRVKRQANPLCESCKDQGKIKLMVLVDHIKPVRDGGAMFDPKNLQSLCRECHDEKTKQDLLNRNSNRWQEAGNQI